MIISVFGYARNPARAMPALLPDARDLLLAFSSIAIDDDIMAGAMNEPDRALRSLDAIHLVAARIPRPGPRRRRQL